MKAQGVIRGKSIVLERIPQKKEFPEGEKVDVIILPIKKRPHRFGTFKLGVKKEHLGREKMYAKN